MAFFTYIIYSSTLDKYYTGHTDNLTDRILEHNSGISTYTSKSNDWQLVFSEEFQTRKEAYAREMAIKRKKSRVYIEWLIKNRTLN